VSSQKTPEISPLFKADSATLSFYASKDGKISVSFSGWDANKVVLEDQVFEVSWRLTLDEPRTRSLSV
jgi:hypothetical protein